MAAKPEITITLKAVDETKPVLSQAGASVKEYASTVAAEAKRSQVSFKELTTTISGLATAGFSLYSMFESVQRSQVQVHRITNTLEDAQRRQKSTLEKLNAEIAEHGANSQEAAKAQEAYDAACKDVVLAQERLDLAQGNLNETILRTATFAIPSLVTFLDKGDKALKLFKGSTDDATVSFNLFKSSMGLSVDVVGIAAAALGVYIGLSARGLQVMQELGNATGETMTRTEGLAREVRELQSFIPDLTGGIDEATESTWHWAESTEDLTKYMTDYIAVLDELNTEAIEKFESQMDAVKESFFDVFTEESEEFKADVQSMAEAVDSALSGMQPDFDLTRRLIEEFARRWGISWEEAKRIIIDALKAIKKENKELVEDTEDTVTKINIAWKGLGIPTRVKREREKKRAGEEEEEEPLYMEHVKRHRKEKEAAGLALPGLALPISETSEGYSGGGAYYEVSKPTVAVVGERGVEYVSRAPPVTVQPQVYITAAPQVNVHIYGQMQPAMIPVISRELKRASYEGISEALRDELRRLGKRIYMG